MREDEWTALQIRLKVGDIVEGIVIRNEHYGTFVDVDLPFPGFIPVTHLKDTGGVVMPADYPAVGQGIKAAIIGFRDRRPSSGPQIWLSVKPSQLQGRTGN